MAETETKTESLYQNALESLSEIRLILKMYADDANWSKADLVELLQGEVDGFCRFDGEIMTGERK